MRKAYQNRNILKSIFKFIKRIGKLGRFIKDKKVPFYKKLMVIGGVLYLLSPIDLIPDPILGFGFIDDVVILGYILSKLSDELDRYDDKVYSSTKGIKVDKDKIVENVEYKIKDKDKER